MHRRFRHAVNGASANMRHTGHGTDIHNRSRSVLHQQRMAEARDFKCGKSIELEQMPPLFIGIIRRRHRLIAAGVVDENVQAFVEVLDPIDQVTPLFIARNISRENLHITQRKFFEDFVAGIFE